MNPTVTHLPLPAETVRTEIIRAASEYLKVALSEEAVPAPERERCVLMAKECLLKAVP